MRLIVFDCDGTIVDSQAGIVLSMQHAFKSLRMIPPTRERTLAVVGLSLPEAFSALAPEAEYATRVELGERYKSAFRELKHDPSEMDILFPQAKETIAHLAGREEHLLGIATGKSRRGIDRLFDREGWHKSFATIQTADDHPSKPHPSMLLEAMRETGASRRCYGHGRRYVVRYQNGSGGRRLCHRRRLGLPHRCRACRRRVPTSSSNVSRICLQRSTLC